MFNVHKYTQYTQVHTGVHWYTWGGGTQVYKGIHEGIHRYTQGYTGIQGVHSTKRTKSSQLCYIHLTTLVALLITDFLHSSNSIFIEIKSSL